jgi:predicted transcriptional regulator
LDKFNDSNYAGYEDMIFNCMDNYFPHPYVRPRPFDFDQLDKDTIGFISHVLKAHPQILEGSTRTFIPAHVRRISHNNVRDVVFDINKEVVVIVINGFERSLQYKDHLGNTKTIPLASDDEEVCEIISRLIIKHNLQHRPVVITGFLCVGMGQTLTHKDLGSFTSAIFGHLDLTNDEIYQLFGRVTGRMKDWGDKYVQTQIYCPTTIMHRCNVMEKCARNMASMHNGDVVTQEEYREPMHKMGEAGKSAIENIRKVKNRQVKIKAEDTDKQHRVFESQGDAIAFGKTLGKKLNKRLSTEAPKELQVNGKNPSVEDLFKRMWGIDEKNVVRMIPTHDNKWCVYWRPSLITTQANA